LSDVLVARAELDPGAPCLLTLPEEPEGELVARSYAEILMRADRLRAVLERHGVARDEPVGCYLANSPAWVVSSFAVWHSGAVVAAVGALLPAVEATRLFQLANVRVVIRAEGSGPLNAFEEIIVDAEGIVSNEESLSPPGNRVLPEPSEVACIFFTSGTTGRPKGITHTHRDFVDGARKVASAYAKSDAYRPRTAPESLAPGVVFNPFGHTAGYGRFGFRLWIGRPSILVSKFSVPAVRALLERFSFDSLQLTPAMVYMLATTDESLSLDSIAYVTSGTAPLAIATRERFEQRYHVPVMQAYGMTEAGSIATERFEDVTAGRRGPGSVGRLSKGVEVVIRDRESRAACVTGEDGEIFVRTTEMPTEFVGGAPVPVDDEGWFATGDVGHFDEHGILYITGRAQEKLIVGGFNVYPAEVEDMLRQSVGVLDAVVVGLPDERLGEIPVAGVVWSSEPDEERLLSEVRENLAHYKVPRFVFRLDEIPLTPREKVDRPQAVALALKALQVRDIPGTLG
jgi:acyl-CoA synthetase (AMP-forming)/AMP-acid ligase II